MGGWEQAANIPFAEALALAQTHFRKETRDALRHAQVCYHSALGLFSNGGTPPDPPALDDEEDEDEDW